MIATVLCVILYINIFIYKKKKKNSYSNHHKVYDDKDDNDDDNSNDNDQIMNAQITLHIDGEDF